MNGTETTNAYGEWLRQYPWSLWTTLTFRHPPSSQRALFAWHKAARRFDGSTFWWVATEEGKLYGRVHLHGLIGSNQIRALSVSDARDDQGLGVWWKERYGIHHIRDYDPEKGAAHYIAKYVSKGLSDWEAGGTWPDLSRLIQSETLTDV